VLREEVTALQDQAFEKEASILQLQGEVDAFERRLGQADEENAAMRRELMLIKQARCPASPLPEATPAPQALLTARGDAPAAAPLLA